jgi:predicted dehydrogenase
MADRVRMAFVGLGRWAENLATAARKSERIEIAACHSRTEGKMEAFTKKFGCLSKKTYEEVIVDPSIDAVVLTTPNSLHAPQAIEAARSGKHIFVEKPMALSVADCKKMICEAK